MGFRSTLAVVFCALSLFGGSVRAENRIGLVIGNSAYQSIARLDNPTNDAKLMAETLKGLGFKLVGGGAQIDLDKAGMDNAIASFGSQVVGANVALFYYAGHGVQIRNSNYLVPVSANPTREADVYVQMIDIALVLSQMEGSGTKLNLVILDACRNNPFGARGLRGTVSGLAQLHAPEGTLISYATQPGNVAIDGSDGNSPYTKALAQTIRRSGLDIFQTFNEVGLAVKRATGGEQQPWLSSSPIDGKFYFVDPLATSTSPSASAPSATNEPVTPPPLTSTSPSASAAAVYHSGWIIQVGALESEREARARIDLARDEARGLLAKADSFTDSVVAWDNRKLFRARFAGLERDQAEAACRALRRANIVCVVVEASPQIAAIAPKATSDAVAPVAQRVVLYDEDPSNPKGKQYVGSVVWRTEPIKATGNQKADIAVRADIEIPDRKFKMTMSFRRNTDSSLPASHTAELAFILPPDFAGGGVGNVPGILMKPNQQARGTPLAGLAVKVTDGFFLVGLSNVDADRQRNEQLLKERSWFDVPLFYTNRRRAIIAIEKGAPGEKAFKDAFGAWSQTSSVPEVAEATDIPPSVLGTSPKLLGWFGRWGAYAASRDGKKVCFALSAYSPLNGSGRDKTYVFVSTRPSENVTNEFLVMGNFHYNTPLRGMTAEVGDMTYGLWAKDNGVWIENQQQEPLMIARMQSNPDLTLRGIGKLENQWTVSLKGFQQALDRVGDECR
jgi:uncharacterized caspase-like protein